jgi:hypothetical protein
VFLEHPLGHVLVTLCGFGPMTGARTFAEIAGPHRVSNGGRLAAKAGLAPVHKRSRKSINNARASGRKNHGLKNTEFLAVFVATQHDPNAKAYCARKREHGKDHNAVAIASAA